MVRKPRMMPPMPSVSAMVCRRPVFLGYLEIDNRGRLVAADLDHTDHIIRAVQGRAPVGGDFHFRFVAEGIDNMARDLLRLLETLGVNIHQADRGIRQLGVAPDIAHQILGEYRAAGADEGYFGHASPFRELTFKSPRFNHRATQPCKGEL